MTKQPDDLAISVRNWIETHGRMYIVIMAMMFP